MKNDRVILRVLTLILPLLFSFTHAAEKTVVIGFAQTGAENSWRVANTHSIINEAAARHITLNYIDGEGKVANQIAALHTFIAQKVDAIILVPLVETGWDDVLMEAKAAGIPVIIMNRYLRALQDPDVSLYTSFIGSDFEAQARLAADWLAKNAGERTRIVELKGTTGSAAAMGRRRGFVASLAQLGKFKLIDTQVGEFRRDKGKEQMAAMLKNHDHQIEIVYAHNDDMALGAVEAIEEAGLKPGKDIIIISFDGVKEAVADVAAGKINCIVESSPLYGPAVFDALQKVFAGEKIKKAIYNKDRVIDETNAKELLPTRLY